MNLERNCLKGACLEGSAVRGLSGLLRRHGIEAEITAADFSHDAGRQSPTCEHPPVSTRPIVVQPGQGYRVGNVEFLARTADTPRFNFGIIEIEAGRELEEHVHDEEDDAFYIVEGEMTFTFEGEAVAAPPGTFVLVPPGVVHGFRNEGAVPVRMLNIHAPAGFDRRIGLTDGG
jgi:mannose-6-phosphate isomerase-like protein (cupin superfamily)